MNRLACVIAVALIGAVGCAEEPTDPNRDDWSGRAFSDGGAAPHGDSGSPFPGYDASPSAPAPDAGTSAPAPDAGAPPPGSDGTPGGGFGCAPDVVPAPTAGSCAASTLTCLEGCEDDACFDRCVAADPAGDACLDCMDDAYLGCLNAAGCQARWDALVCCSDGCADPDSDACYITTCAAETSAYDACATMHDESCATSDLTCFGG